MRLFVLPLLTLALAIPVSAGEGRIEISQASVEAAGGFPVTISSPGNYVLTSDLQVPADTDGFVLDTSQVVLDLNGFAIRGPFSCNIGACALGTGSGVRLGFSVLFGRDITMRNGGVSGFGRECLSLSSSALVTELIVSHCGRSGINVSTGSIVTSNRVTQTGENGIRMVGVPAPAFAHNTVGRAGLGGGGHTAVSGGNASAGNSCDDGSCSRVPKQRYYLTEATFTGALADGPGNCAPGFHFASIWEIWDVSGLKYDSGLGRTKADSGSGPPSQGGGTSPDITGRGWARSGESEQFENLGNVLANCNAWGSNNGSHLGTSVLVNPTESSPDISGPWAIGKSQCSGSLPTWCVED